MSTSDSKPGHVDRWFSVSEVAAHLGVATDTVYRWIDNKGLPAHRVGRLWKFKLYEVDAWVRSGGADESGETGKA
ncbi:MAG: helix-turn-helix domain-containing protein [Bryobacteraceae bacterium]